MSAVTRFAVLLAAIAITAAGCSAEPSADVVEVLVTDNGRSGTFEPATLTVTKGTEVRWRNDSSRSHTATTDENGLAGEQAIPRGAKPWDSGTILPGGTFAHRFDVAGTYVYWSSTDDDPRMVGTVTVKER